MKKKIKIRVTYNAPVTLTFCLACAFIFLVDHFLLHGAFVPSFLSAPACPKAPLGAFNPANPGHYIRLFVHVLGHTSWDHLLGNLSFILLLGPLLEERYGSKMLLLMILVTALVTGVINACLIPATLCGSSGIVFMMIVLASITRTQKNQIPLSFLLVVALFFGREFLSSPAVKGVSTVAHVAGGLCGSMFAFLSSPRTVKKAKDEKSDEKSSKNDETDAKNSSIVEKSKSSGISKDNGKDEKSGNTADDDLEIPAVLRKSKKSSPKNPASASKNEETVIGTIEL